jgi:hypothetical protein
MKKCVLLLLVLVLSTNVWAICKVDVKIDPTCPTTSSHVEADICLCGIPTSYCDDPTVETCRTGNIFIIDVAFTCCGNSSCCKPKLCLTPVPLDGGGLCCGLYIVMVRVWYKSTVCSPCSVFSVPMLCGMGSASFKVTCPNSCWPWSCFSCFP